MKTNPKSLKNGFLMFLALVVLVPVVWILIVRLEGEKPVVDVSLPKAHLGLSQTLKISFSDGRSGLRNIWIGLAKDGKEYVLLQKNYPGSAFIGGGQVDKESVEVIVEPRTLQIPEGQAVLRIVARDFSWRGRFRGNRTLLEKTVAIDTQPPSVAVLTRFHNIAQGGAGLVIYRLSEPCPDSGVYVGEQYYPGYPGHFKNSQICLSFFALGIDQGAGTKMFVKAVDEAGNATVAGFPNFIIKKRFKKDTVNISDGFLSAKMPEFNNDLPPGGDRSPIDTFLQVNRDLRKANYEKIIEAVKEVDTQMYWDGTFLRLPNSARQASFADQREYYYKGNTIDHQVHLGIDLASLAMSPVPAANNGKVTFAGRLGIYGGSVIVDHGFGLFSMYAHLSEIGVQRGQKVAKGDILGRTGSTGMAGGDHLHFSMLVHHTFVNPIEWWDSSWIENNVTSKIREAQSL